MNKIKITCYSAAAVLAIALAWDNFSTTGSVFSGRDQAAHARVLKPEYDEAWELTQRIDRVLALTSQWAEMPLTQRLEELEASRKLEVDADRLFGKSANGEFVDCRAAAIATRFYILDLNSLALVLEGRQALKSSPDMFVSGFHGAQLGAALRGCKDKIEPLAR